MDSGVARGRILARPAVMAMVLGTALTALTPATSVAAPVEPAARVVADLGRYCTACWRNERLPVDLWGDCTQEVFRRLLERVPATQWGQLLALDTPERRELVRAIDAVKKRTQRSKRWTSNTLETVADAQESHRRDLDDDLAIVQQAAAKLLSARQQKILELSFEGWSVQDIAAELHAPAERISDEKYKAIRKLRAHLAGETACV
jgi:RNA polymerase sigma factor (sigma-70 family)